MDTKGNAATPRVWALLLGGAVAALIGGPAALAADAAGSAATIDIVVVTAQKREEAIDTVPMSITAIRGDTLTERGITRTADLARLVPAFTYTESKVGTPIYTLRGVGFSDISMGGRPTVSVYSDEAPIPFTIETRGGNFDLERIEVLKGPQGTLFGQNSTGGAVNLIAAKPTDSFRAGVELGYGLYNAVTSEAFLSGPLGDTLRARVAVQHIQSDGWQKSYTRSDKMGATDLTSGRLILDWRPNDRLKASLNVNGYIDGSESQAPQLIAITPSSDAFAPKIRGLLTYPLAGRDNRSADWNGGQDYGRDNKFVQVNGRVDYDVTDRLTLTSLSSYSHYDQKQLQDIDGTSLSNLQQITYGKISSYFQELRVAGHVSDKAYVVLGANYASDRTRETNYDDISGSTQAYAFAGFGLPTFNTFRLFNNQDIETYAVFGNLDFQLTDTVKLYGGARYTNAVNKFNGCTADSGDGGAAAVFSSFHTIVRGLFGLPANRAIPAGGCISADATFTPQYVLRELKEDNVSWRVGADWQVAPHTMLYANVSKGYKAGGYPTLAATSTSQYDPVLQESVVAYETGFKATLAQGAVQLNGAGFYYDYQDKQVLGIVPDALFGRLLKLVNIPKSRILGAEAQLAWTPIEGLKIDLSGSYIGSKIRGDFSSFNAEGVLQNFGGEPFPNTPKWQLVAGANYRWPVNDRMDAFVGGNANYQSATNTELGELPLLGKKAYTLVDLQAGLTSKDGDWRFTGWVRNVGDTYYWSSASKNIDTTVRFAGMPRTYGLTLVHRFD